MSFSCTAGTDDQDRNLFFHEQARGQFRDQGTVDVGVKGEVELFQGFLVAEVGKADGRNQPFLCTTCDIIIGKLSRDGLAVS